MTDDGVLRPTSWATSERDEAKRSQRTAWFRLLAAGACEVVFAASLKASNGFSQLLPSVVTVLSLVAAVLLLTLALKVLDAAVGYTIWTGTGTVGSVVLGAILFEEVITPQKLFCVLLIIAGVVGLRSAQSERD